MISQVCLALHNIRSTHNVGSIFRTADAIGVSKIYLCGYTPAPVDRFGRERQDIAKVSLGAEKTVAWEAVPDIFSLVSKLKKEKYNIYALEQNKKAKDFREMGLKIKDRKKFLLILGSEVEGIEKSILDKCDEIVEIPMKGKKESLNVSVATGIALFGMFL